MFVSLFIFCIGVQLLYNVFIMLFFSAVQQSESVICIHIYPPFWIPFPLSSPQSIRYSSQCWAVLCLVALLCPTLCNPMGWGLPSSSVHGDSPGKNTGVGCHALLQGDISNPGIESESPAFQVNSLLSEPSGKPRYRHDSPADPSPSQIRKHSGKNDSPEGRTPLKTYIKITPIIS